MKRYIQIYRDVKRYTPNCPGRSWKIIHARFLQPYASALGLSAETCRWWFELRKMSQSNPGETVTLLTCHYQKGRNMYFAPQHVCICKSCNYICTTICAYIGIYTPHKPHPIQSNRIESSRLEIQSNPEIILYVASRRKLQPEGTYSIFLGQTMAGGWHPGQLCQLWGTSP